MSVSDEIRKIENAAYVPSDDSLPALLNLLDQLANERSELNYWTAAATRSDEILEAYTRMAAAISSILMSSNPAASNTFSRLIAALLSHRETTQLVYSLSGFRSTRHLLHLMRSQSTRRQDQGLAFSTSWEAERFLLACTLNARCADDLGKFLARDAQALHGAVLSMLASRNAVESLSLAQKHELLDASAAIANVTPATEFLGVLTRAWQLCSYATTETKHDFKRHCNRMIVQWFSSQRITAAVTAQKQQRQKKPHLLVACESASKTHVMQRCYGHALKQLRQKFQVTAFIAEEDLQQHTIDWCDQLLVFRSDGLNFRQLIDQIGNQKPDIIYYPIIGMRPWSIMLCNLRLAPIQFATLGHPATTHSDAIDYMVMGKDFAKSADYFSEKVVLLKAPGNIYTLRSDVTLPEPAIRSQPSTIAVAVVASVAKLNADFIASCRRIAEQCTRNIEFHFFPNAFGLEMAALVRQLGDLLAMADVEVHLRSDLNGYLQQLNKCDMALSPFPFGGENCALDCLLQGIPIVTLEGEQPHARLDARVMRLAGAPDWLFTQNSTDYEQSAIRLINEDELRCELSQALLDHPLAEKIDEEQQMFATDFVDTARWIYDHHDEMQASQQRVFDSQ